MSRSGGRVFVCFVFLLYVVDVAALRMLGTLVHVLAWAHYMSEGARKTLYAWLIWLI